ncbi:RNA/RNP complex-1-interacting phosphatase homolog isoform X2 [Euwallacea fornicatus]|uniref:RNA/RNP complex-1-interacting phosphatase homolog isoform X2 n=1 Tax=Euwallacea fornicatus TaxID=995702 RepID=UPI00338EE92A
MGEHKKANKWIPDRWLRYKPLGRCILGTKIVAFKVPLKVDVCQPNLPEDKWFTPAKLLKEQPLLKTVIDLTNTHRYYDQQEFGAKGIDHVKIMVDGRGNIPPKSQIQTFFDAIDAHTAKHSDNPDALVGVHCTHGVNRTGFFVCRWMVDRLKINPEEAIARFNKARGHNIERETFLFNIRNTVPIVPHTQITPSNVPSSSDYRSPLIDSIYAEPPSTRRYNEKCKNNDYPPKRIRIGKNKFKNLYKSHSRHHGAKNCTQLGLSKNGREKTQKRSKKQR